ncbi:MAG: lysylphosphatidylglycerol synthase transmembrane domain-containing protein [Paracoccaceae bacterium]
MTMTRSDIPPSRAPLPVASKQWRDRAVLIGLLALVGFGMIGAIAATGWQETLEQLRKISLWQFGALLALSLANYGLRALRWHAFARRLGLTTPFTHNALHFLGGFAMTVTPGRVGELVRMRWLYRETGWAYTRTAPLVLVDRAADLAAMALLMGFSLLFVGHGISGALPVTILALGAAFIATRPRLLAWIATLGHRATGRAPRLFAKLRTAARSLARFSHGGTLTMAGLLGCLGWAAEGYAFYLLLAWMGADIALSTAIAIFIFSALAGGLTGAPGGLGGAEAAMVALLSLEGVPLEMSIPATAIIRLTTLWFAILIGLALFPLAERNSLKSRT